MKTRNKLLTLMILSTGTAVSTALINKWIKISAVSKNVLSDSQALCYKWRLGNIHYTKVGSGKPLLLVHDLDYTSSGYEWHQLIHKLKDNYTVYTIDLLGCGRSEKPDLTYTNYLYVQLISDFIKSEIGHRTDVIATGGSASLAIMACNNDPDLFDQLMLINPDSILTCSQIPSKYAKLYKIFLDLPIIGTLIYHIASGRQFIREELTTTCFHNPYSVKSSDIDAYHESAHLGKSPKSVFASVICNYTKCNIANALKKIDNSIYIVGGEYVPFAYEIIDEYKEYNSAIESSIIEKTKKLPQLENPSELLQLIKMYFG